MSLYRIQRKVRLQDVDAAGILFFPRFLEYCHDAYFEFLETRGMNLARDIREGPWILPLVHASGDFRSPLRFGDEVTITVEKAIAGKTSYSVLYTVRKNDVEQTLCCEARTVHAAVDRVTFRSLQRLPSELFDILEM